MQTCEPHTWNALVRPPGVPIGGDQQWPLAGSEQGKENQQLQRNDYQGSLMSSGVLWRLLWPGMMVHAGWLAGGDDNDEVNDMTSE